MTTRKPRAGEVDGRDSVSYTHLVGAYKQHVTAKEEAAAKEEK